MNYFNISNFIFYVKYDSRNLFLSELITNNLWFNSSWLIFKRLTSLISSNLSKSFWSTLDKSKLVRQEATLEFKMKLNTSWFVVEFSVCVDSSPVAIKQRYTTSLLCSGVSSTRTLPFDNLTFQFEMTRLFIFETYILCIFVYRLLRLRWRIIIRIIRVLILIISLLYTFNFVKTRRRKINFVI